MNKFLLVLLCLLLSSCGFHFRDNATTRISPVMKSIYIQDDAKARTGLIFVLRQNLEAIGITPVAQAKNAPVTLVIVSDGFGQARTTLGTAQQLNAQTLTYTVTVVLRNSKGRNLRDPITLTTRMTYWQNANQILGDTTAVPVLKQNLMREMNQKILAYLSADNTRKALQHERTA